MVIRRSNYSFYGSTASVEYEGVTHTYLFDTGDLKSEWKVCRRAMLQEKDIMMTEKDGFQSLQCKNYQPV